MTDNSNQPPMLKAPMMQPPMMQPPMMQPPMMQPPLMQAPPMMQQHSNNMMMMKPTNQMMFQPPMMNGPGTNLEINVTIDPQMMGQQAQPQPQQVQPQMLSQPQPQVIVQEPVQYQAQPTQVAFQQQQVQQPQQLQQDFSQPVQAQKRPARQKTDEEVVNSTVMIGIIFLISSIVCGILIYAAFMFGMVPWFNYPFDILVCVVCIIVIFPVIKYLKKIKGIVGTNHATYVISIFGLFLHCAILGAECVNLLVSIIPYLFYFIDSFLLFVLFIQLFYAIVICVVAFIV